MVWFVQNLIYRAITLREQELALKSETKVWKLSGKSVGDQLNGRVHPYAFFLLILSCQVLAREHVERAVSMANSRELNKAGLFERIVADMNVNIETKEKNGESTKSDLEVASLPLHRDIYAPLVWIPELGDDSGMTDSTDDEGVDNELSEEEELDELDMDIEMEHESWLWDKAQKFRTSGSNTEVPIMERGQRTTYKSAEFIEDSD